MFFWLKVKKVDPPKMRGSTFFTFCQNCLFTELEPSPVWNFDAILLLQGNFFQIFAFYKRWYWCIFPSVEHRHGHIWTIFAKSAYPTSQCYFVSGKSLGNHSSNVNLPWPYDWGFNPTRLGMRSYRWGFAKQNNFLVYSSYSIW